MKATCSGVTRRYLRMNVERLREPAQRVADKIKSLCNIATLDGEKFNV